MGCIKAGVAAALVAVFASGCATTATSTEGTASAAEAKEAQGYITGSRLPRKATQNTQATRSVTPEEWQRYQPPTGLKSE